MLPDVLRKRRSDDPGRILHKRMRPGHPHIALSPSSPASHHAASEQDFASNQQVDLACKSTSNHRPQRTRAFSTAIDSHQYLTQLNTAASPVGAGGRMPRFAWRSALAGKMGRGAGTGSQWRIIAVEGAFKMFHSFINLVKFVRPQVLKELKLDLKFSLIEVHGLEKHRRLIDGAQLAQSTAMCFCRAAEQVPYSLRLLGAFAAVTRDQGLSGPGKLIALSKLLKAIYQVDTEEKCVLVSHYTSTLNIMEVFCKKKNYSFYRLDGQTPAAKRQEYVNSFNKSTQRSSYSDWNPSQWPDAIKMDRSDLCSFTVSLMQGRLMRRFINSESKTGHQARIKQLYALFPRRYAWLTRSEALMGSSSSSASSKSDSFSRKDLRDIFRIHPNTACNTHDLLECPCDGMVTVNTEEKDDDVSMDSDSDSGSKQKGFVNAAQIRPEEINKADKAVRVMSQVW
ncbi:hypothetical protein C8R45DRAFT_946122 [Mycena sanguinolenta]|nr:hypothetical protein C8R45DRAFT_946122 [Mycena sanguinolenta]